MSPVWHLHLNIHPDVGSAAHKVCRSPFCQCLKLPSQCTIPLSACCLQEMTLCGRHASSRLCLCIGESNQAAAAGVSARAAPPGLDVTMLRSLEDQIQTPSLSSCYCSTLQVGLSSPADNIKQPRQHKCFGRAVLCFQCQSCPPHTHRCYPSLSSKCRS